MERADVMDKNAESDINLRRRSKRPPPPIALPAAKHYAPIVTLQNPIPQNGTAARLEETGKRDGSKLNEKSSTANLRVDERSRFECAKAGSGEELSEEEESEEEIGDEKENTGKKPEKGCRCGRTKCLKQYCACFRNDKRCNSDCVCQDCRNDGNHEGERLLAVRHVRMHSNTAFKGTRLAPSGHEVVTPRGSVRVLRGCRCKKSRCQKKYCECFGAGLACSLSCVCIDCINGNDSAQFYNFVAGGGGLSDEALQAYTEKAKHQSSEIGAREGLRSADGAQHDQPSEAEDESSEESESEVERENEIESDEKDVVEEAVEEPSELAKENKGEGSETPSTCASFEDDETVEATPRGLREIHNLLPSTTEKPTPVQCRMGWETDENLDTAFENSSSQFVLGPPTFSPRNKLRWASFGDSVGFNVYSPRSPQLPNLQRETSGAALRPCTAYPCSPVGDIRMDLGLGSGPVDPHC